MAKAASLIINVEKILRSLSEFVKGHLKVSTFSAIYQHYKYYPLPQIDYFSIIDQEVSQVT